VELSIARRQGPNAEIYATGHLRNHVSSRFRPSRWKTPLNRPPQPQETLGALETLWRARKKMKTASANACHWILANRARVSNPPDCADPGLHPDRRRDHVAKRPNPGRTAARASVEGRHLLHGFFGRLQPRSPALPAAASSHLENQPLSNPLHSPSKPRTKPQNWYSGLGPKSTST
jgi:hypothetical protein